MKSGGFLKNMEAAIGGRNSRSEEKLPSGLVVGNGSSRVIARRDCDSPAAHTHWRLRYFDCNERIRPAEF